MTTEATWLTRATWVRRKRYVCLITPCLWWSQGGQRILFGNCVALIKLKSSWIRKVGLGLFAWLLRVPILVESESFNFNFKHVTFKMILSKFHIMGGVRWSGNFALLGWLVCWLLRAGWILLDACLCRRLLCLRVFNACLWRSVIWTCWIHLSVSLINKRFARHKHAYKRIQPARDNQR